MAIGKPLSLRQQRAGKKSPTSGSFSAVEQAEVLIDSNVYHLSEPYSYLVPANLQGIAVGSVVSVPFNSKQTIGVVVKVGPITRAGLKSIQGLASKYIIPKNLRELAKAMTREYVCTPFDVYRFFLPPLSKSGPVINNVDESEYSQRPAKVDAVISHIGESVDELLVQRVTRNPSTRRICIVPTSKDVEKISARFRSECIDFIEFGSHLSQSQRKRAYEEISGGRIDLVLGTRSAIFAPMTAVSELVVINEASQHMYEQKAPYWSMRELAMLRSSIDGAHLYFVSSSPSTELMHAIHQGSVSILSRKSFADRINRPRVSCAPTNYIDIVRRGLGAGSVLVSVAEKGFSNLFICKRCRNVARCACGGRITMAQRNIFICTLCASKTGNWKCKECASPDYAMLRTGTDKIAEELGKTFLNSAVFLSTAEKPVSELGLERSIVVATSGMEPRMGDGYSAIVLLNGEELVSRPFIRTEEEVLQRWFSTLQHLKKGGEIFVSLPTAHALSQSIITGDPTKFLKRDIEERIVHNLPPARDLIVIESKADSLANLRGKLLEQFPACVANLSINSRRISIMVDKNQRYEVLASLRALQKLRSINKKDLFKIAINPYHF